MRTGLWEDVYTLMVDFLTVSRSSWGGIGEGSILEDEEEKVSFINSSGICVIPHHQQNSDFDWGAWRSLKLFQVALKHFFFMIENVALKLN